MGSPTSYENQTVFDAIWRQLCSELCQPYCNSTQNPSARCSFNCIRSSTPIGRVKTDKGKIGLNHFRGSAVERCLRQKSCDLVQFEVDTSQAMRYANNPRLVIEKAGEALPNALKNNHKDAQVVFEGAEIIPFEPFRSRARSAVP